MNPWKSSATLPVVALLIVLLMAPGSALLGQTSFGGANGTVTDPTAAVVPAATVRLVNQDTNIEAQAESNASGYFTFVNVRPGNYVLRVESEGFKATQIPAFVVGVGQTVTLNPVLELGALTETVEVVSQAELLQPSSSELGNVVEERVVHELPLNGRNFTQLLVLTPGVNPVSVSQGPQSTMSFQSEGNTGIPNSTIANASIQGQQNRSKIYYYDGIINTSVRGTSYVVLPDIDMIQEFRVQSHNDKAEFGGVTGGVVNMYSKSGTNDFHGSAFWYVRNDFFDARDPFRDATREDPPAFRQNQFGANIGGPIIRNQTFFHAGYDGWRYRDVAGGFSRVPTSRELDGDFSQSYYGRSVFDPFSTRMDADGKLVRDQFVNNVIPSSVISPMMQGFLKTYAIPPNLAADPSNNFQQTRSRKSDANSYQVRLDHHFSQVDNVLFRWNEQRAHNFQPVGDRASNSPDFINRNYGGGWIHTFSPTVILEVRGGVATQPSEDAPMQHELGYQPMIDLGFKDIEKFEGLLFDPTTGAPWTSFGQLGTRGAAPRGNPNYSATANLTWLKGNHNVKTGFQFVRIDRLQINNYQEMEYSERPTADPQNLSKTGDTLASGLLGIPLRYFGYQGEISALEFWTSTWSAFVQDEWKLRPDLTFTYGMRYDFVGKVHGKNEYMLQSGPDIDTGLWIIAAKTTPPPCSVSQKSPCLPANSLAEIPFGEHIVVTGEKDSFLGQVRDNFGPRVGLAWQMDEKTVLRGGYGLQWDALPSRSQYGQHQFEAWGWPQSSGFDTGTVNAVGDPIQRIDQLQGTFPFVTPPASPWNTRGYFNDPDRKDGYSHQWQFEVQRQMTPTVMMSVAYVGSKSGRLDYSGGANTALTPGPGTKEEVNARRPVPYMSAESIYSRDLGESSYNSLQYKLQKRFSGGLATLLSYTWSKSIDTSSGWFSAENGIGGQTIQNYHDPDSNRAVSSYDVPHLFTGAVIWDLPFGPGKQMLSGGPLSQILGGWQMNAIVMARSGQPFTPDVTGDIANIGARSGYNYGRPNLIGDPTLDNPTASQWFNGSAFAKPSFSYGNSGRNILRVDDVFNTDFSLFKTIAIAESRQLQVRFEAFNVFNHMDLGNPATRVDQPNAGRITSISHMPRQMQFGLRLVF